MGWKVNNFLLRVSLEVILEGIGDICDANGEVVCVRNGKHQSECGFY